MATGLIISMSTLGDRGGGRSCAGTGTARNFKPRRETLRPLIETLVDRGLIGRAVLPLWVRTYPAADGITIEWLGRVIAERRALRGQGPEEVPE